MNSVSVCAPEDKEELKESARKQIKTCCYLNGPHKEKQRGVKEVHMQVLFLYSSPSF